MKKLENAVTKVKAIAITKLTCIDDVTANAEQMPKICRAMGLSRKTGLKSVSLMSIRHLPHVDFGDTTRSPYHPASTALNY